MRIPIHIAQFREQLVYATFIKIAFSKTNGRRKEQNLPEQNSISKWEWLYFGITVISWRVWTDSDVIANIVHVTTTINLIHHDRMIRKSQNPSRWREIHKTHCCMFKYQSYKAWPRLVAYGIFVPSAFNVWIKHSFVFPHWKKESIGQFLLRRINTTINSTFERRMTIIAWWGKMID